MAFELSLPESEPGEIEAVVEAAEAVIEQPPFNIYDHPLVKEMMAKLAMYAEQLDSVMERQKVADAEYKVAKEAKDDYYQKALQELRKYDATVQAADNVRKTLENQAYEIRRLKDQINQDVMLTVAELEADVKKQEVQKEWDRIIAEWAFKWVEAARPFQLDAIQFGVTAFKDGLMGILIGDQMGLGKTFEADAIIDVIQDMPDFNETIGLRCPDLRMTAQEGGAVLWLCPSAIKESTVRELKKWGRENTILLDGPPDVRNTIVTLAQTNGLTLVVGYEQLRNRKDNPVTPRLFDHEWPIVVMDEAHYFKNTDSSTFTNVLRIAKNAGFILPMTGTPFLNRPDEIWPILHLLTLKGKYEGKFERKQRFVNDFCYSWGNKVEFRPGGSDALIKSVGDMVIRREKKEVLLELPDKQRDWVPIYMGPEQRALYNQLRDRFYIWLDSEHTSALTVNNVLAKLTYLRQIALHPGGVEVKQEDGSVMTLPDAGSAKLDEAMTMIQALLEADEKVLIHCNYNRPLKELQRRLNESGWTYKGQPVDPRLIIGGVAPLTRANFADRFNDGEDNLAVLLGNIKAMGHGLNLQESCSEEIFLDRFWNNGINEQAEDRLHRQGQKSAVNVRILHAEDSVDNFILALCNEKQQQFDGVMDRAELRQMLRDNI